MKELPTLGFMEAIKLASSRILDFQGRSRRSEFWWWMLLVMIANWLFSSLTSSLLICAIIATIVMFFGLAVTVRRLQDTGKSAWWVYISYALGIVNNIMTATSHSMNQLVEMAKSGNIDERAIEKIMSNGIGEFMAISGISALMAIVSIIVIIMCLMDSSPSTNKYGESPKYVEA